MIDKITIKRNYANYYKRFQQLSKKPVAKVSGLISLTIFAVAFFMIFAILPTFKTIAALNREIEDTELVDSKLQKKIVSLNRAEEEFGRLVDDLKKIEQVLPKDEGFERLAWQIHWLAKENNVTITAGSFGEFGVLGNKIITTEATELTMEMSLTGDYPDIKRFLEVLSKFDRLIKINEVTITKKKVGSQEGSITVNIEMMAYNLAEEKII
ncbi:type 4a pilus biogenesis protein PilO [Patescibacteria group bacterium]